ncbi:TetR/AcrR family transcriptional regulator [Alkaliphilus sp. MSJ-5]|uniref:TetR/AcrR family transcriptional regulator n=1 Tax=Alkaliphilus flagellatus TaxID=2841507 RepID=A0ABS6FYN4_9FIRM|nr:TetR/AcrR family transcriptional regulator [Alkaliphilus flagellatus]MBU5675183.1 TetR/AcrR family transcriptional regulator [Alkaliphilus flagellatus]
MPKIVSENEKQRIKELMFEKGVDLIKQKGIKKVTVEDITKAAGIGKGSFYLYYDSKEELLYDILKRCETNMFNRIEALKGENIDKREKAIKAAKEIYLAPDSIILYVSPTDFENLLHRLPSEIYEKEKEKSKDYFKRTSEIFEIDETVCDVNVLSQLMDALSFVASNSNNFYSEGRQKALDILVTAIAEYIAGEDS